MAELAVTDGMPPPGDLPHGDCICTRLADGSIRIDRADPRVLIAAEVLAEIFIKPMAGVSLSPEHPGGHGYGVGTLLKICGVNRTVIYRITDYLPRVHAYVAEWPD